MSHSGGNTLMKAKKKILILGIVILLSLIGRLYYYSQELSLDYRKLLNQIEQKTYHQVEINQELYGSIIEEIELKVGNKEEILPIEQFFLGYKAYFEGDYEKAYNYYMPISRIEIPYNDNLANVLMNVQLNRICMTLGKNEEAVRLTYHWFDYYEEKLMKKHLSIIHTLVGELLSAGDYTNVVIELYERIIAHKDSASYEFMSYIKQGVQTLNSGKGNYGRALEIGMEELAKAEAEGNNDIIAVQKYAIGSIYAEMHNYEYAKEWLGQCLQVEANGSQQIAYYKVMSATNFIQCAIMANNFKGVEEAIEAYKENLELMEERFLASTESYFALTMAKYYTAIGELSQAAEMLEVAHYTMDEQNASVAYRVDFLSVSGPYYMAIGAYEKAVQDLQEVVNSDYVMNAQSAAQILIDYYIEIGDTEHIKKYTDRLQELNNKVQKNINASYADYAAYKYQYELTLREMNAKKMRDYAIFFVCIMAAIIMIGTLYFRLKYTRRMNQLDGLTQIFNRGYFNKKYEVLKKQGSEFYLVMFDIDNFKKINDTYGHVYGDYVIKNIAQITKKTLGKTGQVFRYGGEEFAVIFEGKNQEQVLEQSEAIRKAVEVFEWDMSCKVTVSIGMSYNKGRETDVINEADKWLYEAKKNGKNRVCYQY